MNYIKNIVKSDGLPPGSILKLLDAMESGNLSVSALQTLLTYMVQRNTIPDDAILRMTSFLGDLSFDMTHKIEILQWMVTALPLLDSLKTKFHCLYEIYLNLLEYEALRPNVICLLKLISTKEHVTSRRIQFVVDLFLSDHKGEREELLQHLYSMINIFYRLRPQLVIEIFPEFKKLSCKLEKPVPDIHSDELDSNFGCSDTDSIHTQVYSSFEKVYKTFCALKESPIEEILKSDFRRLLISSDTDVDFQTCFYDYLLTSSWFEDFNSSLPLILEVLHETQEPIDVVFNFIDRVIHVWDGYSFFPDLLDILSYEEICCFENIVDRMNILKQIMQTAPLITKCHLLYCLSRVYQNWAYMAFGSDGNPSSMQHRYELSSFDCKCQNLNVKELLEYSNYLDFLCDDLLAENDINPCLLNQVLFHYKRMNIFNKKHGCLILHYPTDTVFNSVLFCLNSQHIYTMKNFCEFMLGCYSCIRMGSYANATEIKKKYLSLLDFCDIQWNKELNKAGTFQTKKKAFTELQKYFPSLKNLFMFLEHSAFVLQTTHFDEDRQTDSTKIENVLNIEDIVLPIYLEYNKHFVNFE